MTVSTWQHAGSSHLAELGGELSKLPAFLRRDVLVAWSYRVSFYADWLNLAFQAVLFALIGRIVDPSAIPEYGAARPTYLEFAAVGIAVSAFMALALIRLSSAIRHEQVAGTLESLLLTPTTPATIQIGSVAYDLVYIPIRTGIFLVVVSFAFGLDFRADGVLAATAILLAFIPFVWGLGLAAAAATLTIRRGTTAMAFGITMLAIGSGAYFPLDVLPGWVSAVATVNPMTAAIEGMRSALLTGGDWHDVGRALTVLAPASVISLAGGFAAFRLGIRRERRRGTLGLY